MEQVKIIGVCGGSGSGKTTLVNRLASHFEAYKPVIFSMDNYYKALQEQQKDEKGYPNFDLPEAIDRVKLIADLSALLEGKAIRVKEYNYNTSEEDHYINIQPSRLIFIEGLFIFHFREIFKRLDFSVFIDLALEIQLARRLSRDLSKRGYTHQSILYQWENHVIPCYKDYMLPYRDQANFIFRNDEHAEEDFSNLMQKLKEIFP